MAERPARAEICAGGVVYRRAGGGFEMALAEERDRLTGAANTRLAKGHVEPTETPETAAIREVREEIGIAAEIVAALGSVHYTYVEAGVRVAKEVHFFLMEASSEEPAPLDGEMQRMYWCAAERAAARLTFETERRIVERAQRELTSRSAG